MMAKHCLLITRPSYDDGTAYLSSYSSIILKLAQSKGIETKDFFGKNANASEINKYVSKKSPRLLFINGHGGHDLLEGDKNEILFSVQSGLELLKNKIVYARACHAGLFFGKEMVKNNFGCFIGYKYPFSFWISDQRSTTPLKDNVARLFLKPSNYIVSSLISGKTTKEAHEESKNKMIESMQKVLNLNKKNEPGAMELLKILWTNYKGQVLHGNEKATFN
jgi:hypothetical protein